MTYHVLYRLSTGALLDIEIPAANAQLAQVAP